MTRSLSILDNHYVRLVLVALLVAYAAGLAPQLNHSMAMGLRNMYVRALVLLVIMYVSVKDTALAMLLAVAYVLTVHMSGGNVEGMNEVPEPATEEEEMDSDNVEQAHVEEGMESGASTPTGYNTGNNACLQDCADGTNLPTGNVNEPCGSVATWDNESNAQGMNCPMGYGGDELANF
jgi:hypothetical protein